MNLSSALTPQLVRSEGLTAAPHLNVPAGALPCWKALERYSWAGGLAFVSHGVRLGIRVTEVDWMDSLLPCLPPGWEPAASPAVETLFSLAKVESRSRTQQEPHFFLHKGACRVAHTRSLEEILPDLESLLHSQVAAQAQEKLFVHAGVVGWRGQAIIVPGRSRSGKTSLVAALVRAGATYFSDEYAVFGGDGMVYPYAKPLSLRTTEGEPRQRCSAEALGGETGTEPIRAGLVVSTHYEDGSSWRPRRMAAGTALFALLDNTVRVREAPLQALQVLQPVAMAALAVKSKRGEANCAAEWLLAHMPA